MDRGAWRAAVQESDTTEVTEEAQIVPYEVDIIPFIDEEDETQRSENTCPGPWHSKLSYLKFRHMTLTSKTMSFAQCFLMTVK